MRDAWTGQFNDNSLDTKHFRFSFPSFSSEEVETSPVVEYISAPHPQLAHLPQLPHPLSVTVKTVKGKVIRIDRL